MPFESIRWKRTVKIKDLLSESEDPYEAVWVAREIATRLLLTFPTEPKVAHLCRLLKSLQADGGYYDPVEELNYVLDRVYDWADQNQVWVE